VLEATVAADTWRSVYRVEAAIAVVVFLLSLRYLRGGRPVTVGVSGLASVRLVPGWRRLLWAYGLFATGMSLFVSYMVAVLEEDAAWSSSAASLAFTAVGVGTVVGGPVFGPLSDRLGRAMVLVIAFSIMTVTALVLPTGARPWSLVAAFCFGAAFTGVPTTIAARVSDYVAAESFGAAFGVATLSFGFGLMIGPQLGGLIGDVAGSFRPVFALSAACALVGAVLSWDGADRPLGGHSVAAGTARPPA
jgi:predicted MFS family arabinose efflux permease